MNSVALLRLLDYKDEIFGLFLGFLSRSRYCFVSSVYLQRGFKVIGLQMGFVMFSLQILR